MFFFFQAEDGIRDSSVTGVQTCALPISGTRRSSRRSERPLRREDRLVPGAEPAGARQIGRAACRERGEISVVAVSLKKKKKRRQRINDLHERQSIYGGAL